MRIDRVKLSGFKSFVDPAELRVLPGLTGVVGPNGCGKSNLLEAIRWVMGEGSPKSLRGAAMDDVIFAGTATRPQRQFAEVSILAERDDDEVEVVRRIERGAGSAYRINGRDARARDAQLLFADAATGAHSPALVSQGRIGAIIAAKPAERRQMLEEAAGISGLHVRRREAELRLKATETNLARVAEQVAEHEARIAVLRRQARSAERYRKLSDEIKLAEARLIYARWRDAAAAAETARSEAKAADEAVFAASEAQRAAAAWANEATGALAHARSLAQAARDEAADARHRLSTVETERAAVEKRIADLKRQTEQLQADHAREGELARDASEAIARLSEEIGVLEAAIAESARMRPALAQRVAAGETACSEAEVALAQAVAAAARDTAERRVADAAMDAATHRRERVAAALAQIDAAIAEAGDLAQIERARIEAANARAEAETVAAAAIEQLDAADGERAAAASRHEQAEADAAAAAAGLAALDAQVAALRRDLDRGEGALTEVRAAPGYEAALAAALADDLNAGIGVGPRRWTGSAFAHDDPALPVGTSLRDHVEAPPELARRLSQIAVVISDEGATLAVGQRLVTMDGRLRRWDGFESDESGSATAERLKRQNRLIRLEADRETARAVAKAAIAARDAASESLANAKTILDRVRNARDAADTCLRGALRDEDQANAAFERAKVRATELAERHVVALSDLRTADDDVMKARTAIAELPAAAAPEALDVFEHRASAARARAVALRSELVELDGQLQRDTKRSEAARREIEDWRARSGKAGKRVEDMARRASALDDEAAALVGAPERLNAQAGMIGIEAARLADVAQATADAERAAERDLRDRESRMAKAAEALAQTRETRAGAQARTEAQELRRIEMGRVAGERFECPAALLPEKLAFDAGSIGLASDESARLERATLERERLGPVNLVAESELAEIEAQRDGNAAEAAELTEAVHRLRGSIGNLNREGRQRLRSAFEAVNDHFRTLFGTLFNGGEAHLSLIDSDDPLEAGLEIMAQPPGKRLSSLTLLSGGEQALTAVALIFALFLTNPAPLCVLDEVDAPLDDANVERFCDLLDAMAKETATRYLIVTHNAVTMSRMHRLYGVTMVEQGISRLVSVDLGSAEALLAAE